MKAGVSRYSPVDNHDLSELAMWSLRTVEKHRLRVLDHDVESTDRIRAVEHRGRNEPRVQCSGNCVLQWGTWACRTSRLCDGVIREEELKLEHVARVCLHVVGGEYQGSINTFGPNGDGDELWWRWCFYVGS